MLSWVYRSVSCCNTEGDSEDSSAGMCKYQARWNAPHYTLIVNNNVICTDTVISNERNRVFETILDWNNVSENQEGQNQIQDCRCNVP